MPDRYACDPASGRTARSKLAADRRPRFAGILAPNLVSAVTLPAKVRMPEADGARLLQRTRLFEALDAAGPPCMWVCGPPGAGKTVLLQSWVQARRLRVLWYRTDAGDADPALMPHFLRRAADSIRPGLAQRLPELSPDRSGSIDAFAAEFFTPLFDAALANVPRRAPRHPAFVMVIDNLDEALESSAFVRLVAAAAENLPAQRVRLMLLARSEPVGPFARLKLHEQIGVIGGDALALDLTETRDLLALRRPRLTDDPAAVERVHQWCRGWVSGVVLASTLALDDRRDRHEHDREALFNYVADTLFAHQSDAVRERMLAAALLPSFTAAMVDAVRDASPESSPAQTAQVFERMVAGNLFTVVRRRADEAPIYEYHALAREFLVARGLAIWPAAQRRSMLRRAAHVLAADGQIEAAAQAWLQAGDLQGLATLICAEAETLLASGRHLTLAGWLAALPEAQRRADPWLSFWEGQSKVLSDPAQAKPALAHAFDGFAAGADEPVGLYLAWCTIVETIALEWRDFSDFDPWIARGAWLNARHPLQTLPAPLAGRFACAMVGALMGRQPWHPDLPRWVSLVRAAVDATTDRGQRIVVAMPLVNYYAVLRGDHRELAALYSTLRGDPGLDGMSPLQATLALIVDAAFAWMRARPDDAVASVGRGRALCQRHGMRLLGSTLHCHEVYAHVCAGRLEMALAAAARIRGELEPARALDAAHIEFIAASVELQAGRPQAASRLLQAVDRTAAIAAGPHQWSHNLLADAQIRHALGEPLALTRRRVADAIRLQNGARCDALWFVALTCLALFELDNGRSGRAALRRAFALGARNDLLCYVGFRRAMLARLCVAALLHGIEPEYTRRLIEIHDLAPPSRIEGWPWAVKVHVACGRWRFEVRGQPLASPRSAPGSPLRLLQGLIELSRPVPLQPLAAAPDVSARPVDRALLGRHLRPNADPASNEDWIDQNLKRLRRRLDCPDVVLAGAGQLALNPRRVWVDILDDSRDPADRRDGSAT